MAYKEELGKVVGDDGDTYTPTRIINNENGTINIEFTNQQGSTVIPEGDIQLPYLVPVVDNKGGNIVFVPENDAMDFKDSLNSGDSGPYNYPTIPLEDIKGDPGEKGDIEVEFLPLNQMVDNINRLKPNKIYLDIQPDDIIDDGINDEVNAYIVVDDGNGNKTLNTINKMINLSGYVTQEALTTNIEDIHEYIESNIQCVVSEQREIYNMLNNGIEIDDNEIQAQPSESTINVMSDASVEELRLQILNELQEYIKESEITFDSNTGKINIKM